jgi:aminoglycoside 6'-N-acetyltransferase I
MAVRLATQADAGAWCGMRAALWPDEDADELRREAEAYFRAADPRLAAVFIGIDHAQRAVGMLELSLRPYADGCTGSPVPYVEAWYVAEQARGQGIGRALMDAAERWALDQGYDEMASDVLIANAPSLRAHGALGFDEVERAIHLRKDLKRP